MLTGRKDKHNECVEANIHRDLHASLHHSNSNSGCANRVGLDVSLCLLSGMGENVWEYERMCKYKYI